MKAKDQNINCNLKQTGIRHRQIIGLIGAISYMIIALIYILSPISETDLFFIALVFSSSSVSSIGFLQARLKFCAAFGVVGIREVDNHGAQALVKKELLKAQRLYALRIILYALLIATLITIATIGLHNLYSWPQTIML